LLLRILALYILNRKNIKIAKELIIKN